MENRRAVLVAIISEIIFGVTPLLLNIAEIKHEIELLLKCE